MIFNLGSINADMIYVVPSLPLPGETMPASGIERDLGGKGANMSIAAARAGGQVRHIGAVGADGIWAIDTLHAEGIDTKISVLDEFLTGQAVILREPSGENAIITLPGANQALEAAHIHQPLSEIGENDLFLFQNETNLGSLAAKIAQDARAHVVYAAAPFDSMTAKAVLARVETLILNEIEMAQLQAALGCPPDQMGPRCIIVTKGSRGATLFERGLDPKHFAAPAVKTVDTTGAGDTLTGYLVAGLDAGRSLTDALENAIAAAALMTTKKGTASAVPLQADVDTFRSR